jgi:hypothetical protein
VDFIPPFLSPPGHLGRFLFFLKLAQAPSPYKKLAKQESKPVSLADLFEEAKHEPVIDPSLFDMSVPSHSSRFISPIPDPVKKTMNGFQVLAARK